MTIKTKSAFTYGHTVTLDNQSMPFSEDDITELVATFRVGAYTLEDFATEMARAMNEVGALTYVASVDRNTRQITIQAGGNFYLYVESSPLKTASPYTLLGFTTERSGAALYVGDEPSGSIFRPQFKLQAYVAFQDFQKANAVTVNETASGKVQVVKYGDVNFMVCNIMFQTNIRQGKGSEVEDNPNGEDELRDFMKYIVTKAPIEFIPNRDNMAVFTDCLLEKVPGNQTGTGFKLKEMYSNFAADWWETGKITFREIK